ncbi:hypothetical protein DMH17_04220 [Raoultella planticola]|nr:hypothetical protein [Raoultella planticola]
MLFSGPPDQPLLNIEAIRNPDATEDDVIAGVHASPADQPAISLTRSCRSKKRFLYLLRGQGLSSGQSDSAAMTSMLIGMGLYKVVRLWVKSARRLA